MANNMNRRHFLGGALSTLGIPLTLSACGGQATTSIETPVVSGPTPTPSAPPITTPAPVPAPALPALKIALAGSSSPAEYLSEYDGPGASQAVRVTRDGSQFSILEKGAFGKIAGQAINRSTGRSVDYIDAGAKGTTLKQWASKDSMYLLRLIDLIKASGGADIVLLQVGRNDAAFGLVASRQGQLDMIKSVISDIRVSCGQPDILFVLGASQDLPGVDAATQELLALQRLAELDAAASISNVWYGFSTYDLPTRDGIHQSEEGQIVSGARFAEQVISYVGKTTPPRGPRGASAVRIDATTLNLDLNVFQGISFEPDTNISGFYIRDQTGLFAVTAVKTSPTTVRITHKAQGATKFEIRYALDADLDAQICLHDTSSTRRPMEPLMMVL